MKEKEKGIKWDGRSRVSTEQYKHNWNEIFSNNTTVKHKRSRHQKDKATTHRELRRDS